MSADTKTSADNTARFSDRVDAYVKYRPSYPDELFDCLIGEGILFPDSVVADIGSGTGFFSALLARRVRTVKCVEPNDGMRNASVDFLSGYANCEIVKGTAEHTSLEGSSVDCVTVAQAFHWFDRPTSLAEFRRILKSNGKMILVWNDRLVDTPFLESYEAALKKYGNDYEEVNHQNLTDDVLAPCFRDGFTKRTFPNFQEFDFDGVMGRLTSSSYAPAKGSEKFALLRATLRESFDRESTDGKIRFNYGTDVYWGTIG